MKWKQKGRELDETAKKIMDDTGYTEKVYIYGARDRGRKLLPVLKSYSCFCGFIDKDRRRQAQGYLGERCISFEEYIAEDGSGLIIICASDKNEKEISGLLESNGLVHKVNYFFYEEFIRFYFPIIALYYYHQTFLPLAQIVLTEICTLKCDKCAHACASNVKAEDMSISEAVHTVDLFFEKVDYIQEFVLIGGEPFLFGELAEIIRYIGETYRHRIGILSITTNGTIMPKDEVLDLSSRYRLYYQISDYSKENPWLKIKIEQLKEGLESRNIAFEINEFDWIDFDFEHVDRQEPEDEMISFFDKCHTECREVRDGKYFYCVMARAASHNLSMHVGGKDYLDFTSLPEDYRKILLEFDLGYSDKGYLQMCRHCAGSQRVNQNIVPAGKQKVIHKSGGKA